MHLTFRGVNDAFRELVEGVYLGLNLKINRGSGNLVVQTRTSTSRNGNVYMIDEPVIITILYPRERVLFNQARDCNPFFHLYESLWMLAGRNDVKPLTYYASKMGEFSDDGVTQNGAYGYRWRHADSRQYQSVEGVLDKDTAASWRKSVDQLDVLIEHLKAQPDSRRAVLQMWNVEDDLLKIGPKVIHHPDESGEPTHEGIVMPFSKDVCCNLSVCFSIRTEAKKTPGDIVREVTTDYDSTTYTKYLDMTVFNRSNDLIWGYLGANIVHFSMLQEYMACCLDCEVGVYNQISNNMHVYEWNWKPEEWLADKTPTLGIEIAPLLVKNKATFDEEVKRFVAFHDGESTGSPPGPYGWSEPFLENVARPMLVAFHYHKERRYSDAERCLKEIQADDWRIAATNWINKRKTNWESKQSDEKGSGV